MGEHSRMVIVGGGGHARVLIELLRCLQGYTVEGIVDPGLRAGDRCAGITVLGGDEVLPGLRAQGVTCACVGVGRVGRNDKRGSLFLKLKQLGFHVPALVHPAAVVAGGVMLDDGVQVMAGAVIQPGTRIGENSIVNTAAVVDHDCTIGSNVHLCPGSVLSGGCTVADGVFVGAAAVLIHGIAIGADAVVGAGAVVVRNILPGATVKGVPAR